MKTVYLAVLLLVASAIRASPAEAEPDAVKYEVSELRYQGWASQVLLPELAEDLGYLAPVKLKWVGNTISGPRDIQSAVTGDTDFGGAFNGSIVKLIAARAPLKAVIAYYGADRDTYTGLYVLDDNPITTPHDLLGKKVGMNTLGAYQEYLLTDYLIRAGFTRDDVKQVTLVAAPPMNLAQMLRQKQVDATFLADIARDKAVEQSGVHALMTDFGTYGAFSLASYVLTDKFIKENPNAAHKFVEAIAKAIEWARATPRDEVITRMRNITAVRQRNEDPAIVDYWKSIAVAGKGGLIKEQEFADYIDWYVKTGQLKEGQIRASDVYTNRFNPYRDVAQK